MVQQELTTAEFQNKLNKLNKGIPKFKLLNQPQNYFARNFNNGNHFEVFYYPDALSFGMVSQKQGITIVSLPPSLIEQMKKQPGSKAWGARTADIVISELYEQRDVDWGGLFLHTFFFPVVSVWSFLDGGWSLDVEP